MAGGPAPSWRRWPATPRPRCCARPLTRRRCCFPPPAPGKWPGWPGTMPGCAPPPTCWPGQPREWYPLTEGPVVDLDALPLGQAVAAAVDRLLRMHRGEQLELQSGTDLDQVWREGS